EVIDSSLRPFGYDVVPAASAEEALALARRSRPQLILSDLHLPGRDGISLFHAIRADPTLRAVPFAFITSSRMNERERLTVAALGGRGNRQPPDSPGGAGAAGRRLLAPRRPRPTRLQRTRLSPWPPFSSSTTASPTASSSSSSSVTKGIRPWKRRMDSKGWHW